MDTRARIAVVFLAALAVPAGARAQSYSAPTPNYFIQKPLQQVIKTSPQVNSVYSQPMQRTNEIPLYGRNKGAYFYAQPKRDEGLFSGGGLYAFGAISAGDTVGGINMERAV
ncbi:MAG: hypothetical protein LBI17_03685, partial [Rickettsiales bacterium]|nr:hypothetical protein [Rickettsiales bacterium]